MNRDDVPRNAESYIFYNFRGLVPPDIDYDKEEAGFRQMAHRVGMTFKGGEDAWDKHCRDLQRKHEAVIEREKTAAVLEYGNDKTLSSFEAENEITRIMQDTKHSYFNPTALDHRHALAYMNRLVEIKAGLKTDFGGYLSEIAKEDAELRELNYGNRSSSNGVEESDFYKGKLPVTLGDQIKMPGSGGVDDSIGYGKKETSSASGDVKKSSAYDGRVYERKEESQEEGDQF